MSKPITDKQKKFLDALFEEAQGHYPTAKRLAGYSENTATRDITGNLRQEIAERTEEFINRTSAKAAYTMYDVMSNPTALGNKDRMAAAKDLLDRAGYKPKEKVEVTAPNPLFILPAKTDG